MTLPSHTLRALLATFVLVLIAALPPVPASAAEKGIETDMTWGLSNRDRDRTVAGVQDLGATWQRITIAWHDIETSEDGYSMLGHYDDAIEKAALSGTKIVATVYTGPEWATGSSERETPPRDPADYADFIRFAGARWGDKIDAWEIWNEQNLTGFWSTGPNPAQYARLLMAAYPAVKAVDPSAPVVYGGTAYNDYNFLEGAYQEVPNLGDYYDVMATHPYTNDASAGAPTSSGAARPPEDVWFEADGRIAKKSFAAYREVHNVMLAHGDDKPIWFTEFGWSSNTADRGVTAEQQADYYTRAMRCIEQDPYVEVAVWYSYRNSYWANDANTWLDQLGLVSTDFSPKPAYNAFKSYTPGNQGCTYNYPAPAPAPEPEPEPVPVPEPEPAPEPAPEPIAPVAEPEPDTIETSAVRHRVGLRLLRSAWTARTASRRDRPHRPTRVAIRARGRVFKAERGRVELRLTCRNRGEGKRWSNVRERRTAVRRSGRFVRRLRPRTGAACILRARYRSTNERISKSRLVRFKT